MRREEIDHHQLDVEAHLDDMTSFADTDDDESEIQPTDQQKWHDHYLGKEKKNVREYFLSRLLTYLLHVEGGAHSDHQVLVYVRQVHKIIDVLDAEGTDPACLAKRGGLDIWDKFCVPRLCDKILTGNTLKVYLGSLEYFARFIQKGLLYKKELLPQRHKEVILSLRERLPDYQGMIHRQTAHQNTTRKVDESYARITPADLCKLESAEICQKAIKLIGKAAEKKPLLSTDFVNVRDYLLVTTL